jgi:hypothetical protein
VKLRVAAADKTHCLQRYVRSLDGDARVHEADQDDIEYRDALAPRSTVIGRIQRRMNEGDKKRENSWNMIS